MKIERKDIDALNTRIELSLAKEDYSPEYQKKIKEVRSNIQMKGFRQGKAPMSIITKRYGREILAEVINEMLSTKLNNYLVDEKINYLGQPLSAEDQVLYDFDPSNMEEYAFSFDLGIKPEIKIKGYTKQTKYNDYKIDVPSDLIDKEIKHMQSQLGERLDIEDSVEENDVIKLASIEQDGKKDKEDGVTAEISTLVSRIHNEKLKKKILKLKKGDSIVFDVYDIEEVKDEKHLKKFILGIDEDQECGNMFKGEIIEVKRVEPAQLNEETFKKYFGDDTEVKTEEDARAKIKENMENYFAGSALSLSNRDMLESIIDKNDFALPENILKKWLTNVNADLSSDEIDADLPAFLKDLRWRLIKNKIAKENDVKVTPEEIRSKMYVRVESYFRNNYMFDVKQINSTVDQLMQDQEQLNQVQEEILSDKIFDIVRTKVGLKEVLVTPEELNKKIDMYNN